MILKPCFICDLSNMIYYCIVPKQISEITIAHSNFINYKKIQFKIEFKDLNGRSISVENKTSNYPFVHSIKNNNKADVYFELSFLVDNDIIENGGTFNVFYKTKRGSFGIEYGCIGKNANSIEKNIISTSIVKNCCYLSENNNTAIYIINPNPQNCTKTERKGHLNYKIFNENGKTVYSDNLIINPNEAKKIDIKEKLFVKKYKNEQPSFYTFVSENDFNVFPITFLENNGYPTGCEHSQPRFSYFRLPLNGSQNIKYNIIRLVNSLFK